ncbi:MAG: FHA domain-containing protein [Bacteriovoracia bacterium]
MGAAKLTVLRDGEMIQEIPVDRELAIGRDAGCVIRLDHRMVSRQHAVVRPSEGGIQVEKKSGFAPLSVNGLECTKAVLKGGDVINIGPFLIQVAAAIQEGNVSPRAGTRSLAEPSPTPDPLPPMDLPTVSAAPSGATLPVASEFGTPVETPKDFPSNQFPAENLDPPGDFAAPAEASADPDPDLAASGEPASDPFANLNGSPESSAAASSSNGPLSLEEFSKGIGASSGEAPLEVNLEGGEMSGAGTPAARTGTEFVPADVNDGNTRVAATGKLRAKLVFAPGAANVREFEITQDEVVLGRGKNCDIVLNDKKSSRKNTTIRREGIRFIIKDLGSSNGTYVNGVRVTEQELTGDDEIRVGDVYCHFQALSADYQAKQNDFMTVPDEPEEQDGPPGVSAGFSRADGGLQLTAGGQNYASPSGLDFQPEIVGAPVGGMGADPMAAFGAGPIPGLGAPKGRKSLVEQFREMPPRRRVIVGIVGLVILFSLLDYEEEPSAPAKPAAKTATAPGAAKGKPSFDKLSPDKKEFVKSHHTLAFDHYKNGEFDKALYEVAKIFEVVDDYEDSRDIERYAREGKKRMQDKEEEKRRREEQERIRLRVAELVDAVGKLMAAEKYEDAKAVFPEILQLDPDNKQLAQWEQVIRDHLEKIAQEEQARKDRQAINGNAWRIYRDGQKLQKRGRYLSAVGAYRQINDLGATDRKLLARAKSRIAECLASLKALLDPVLEQAKSAEEGGDLVQAFKLYERATKIDPRDQTGFKGMERIRGVLHQRAKLAYSEAIIAESYSDFEMAKRKYAETMNIAPQDDIYYERARNRISRFDRFKSEGEGGHAPAGGSGL